MVSRLVCSHWKFVEICFTPENRRNDENSKKGFNEIVIVFCWNSFAIAISVKRFYSSRILFVIQILLQSITTEWIHHHCKCFFFTALFFLLHWYLIALALFSNFSSSSHDGFWNFTIFSAANDMWKLNCLTVDSHSYFFLCWRIFWCK